MANDCKTLYLQRLAFNSLYSYLPCFDASFFFHGSGTYKFTYEQEEGTPKRGVELVRPFVEWLNKNNLRGIIGEYGIPEGDERWEKTLDNFLVYLQKNGVPALYWASGPWWTDAVMTIPTYRGGKEKPQVKIMEKYKETK